MIGLELELELASIKPVVAAKSHCIHSRRMFEFGTVFKVHSEELILVHIGI